MGSDANPQPLMAEPYDERFPMISPDGHWIAYMSNESGQNEVYLRSFPEPGTKFRVSTDGGTRPAWPSSGRELFYRNGDRIMVVDIRESGAPIGRPRVLFEASDSAKFQGSVDGYDVAPDGQHFVMIEATEPDPTPTHLHLVMNWGQELERLVPTGR